MANINFQDTVFHYTSLSSFAQILTTEQFKTSLFKNANDYRERKQCSKWAKYKEEYDKRSYISTSIGDQAQNISPMWAHYSNKYNGVCIGLDFKKLSQKAEMHNAIVYDAKLSDYDNLHFEELVFSKRKEWSYECEYRFIFNNKQSFELSDIISSVCFGQVDDELIVEYIKHNQLLKNLFIQEKIYRCCFDYSGKVSAQIYKNPTIREV